MPNEPRDRVFEVDPAATSVDAVRRPYTRPTLRRLGSVRDLTLGLTGPNPDFQFGGQKH